MKKIAIIGAGGFGQEVACIINNINRINPQWDCIGFFDDTKQKDSLTTYGKILGPIEDINTFNEQLDVAIAVGNGVSIKNIRARIINTKLTFPNIIDPSLKFLDENTLNIGEGNIFSLDVIISCNVNIGNHNIFNTRVTLGHDVNVGNYNIFSPNAQISGSVNIGDQNYLGFNCGVIQRKNIGNSNIIGAGAILLRSIKDEGTYIGVPAKRIMNI